jgi:hypothetical protein
MHTTTIDQLRITRWDRPIAGDPLSIATPEALTALAPRLGPTATLFLHRCAWRFDVGMIAEFTSYDDLAAEFGVGTTQMVRTVERVIRFGYGRWVDTDCHQLEVATTIGTPPLAPLVAIRPTEAATIPADIA